jgi:hypothetical protein
VPSREDLLAEFERNKVRSAEEADLAAQHLLGVHDRPTLQAAVYQLLGPPYVPRPSSDMWRHVPADGAWGDAHFSMYTAQCFQNSGWTVTDAKDLRNRYPNSIRDLEKVARFEPQVVLDWAAAGIRPWLVVRALEGGLSLADVVLILQLGVHPVDAVNLSIQGLHAGDVTAHLRAGETPAKAAKRLLGTCHPF